MKKLLFIINPVAGKKTSRTVMFDIINLFCKNDFSVRAAVTQYRGHGTQLAENAAKEGFDLVVCIGGDGTLNEVLTGLIKSGNGAESPVPIGYIPAGSTNDFADTLKISPIPLKAAQRICDGDLFSLDVGEFTQNEGDSSASRNFSYIASFGAFSEASYSAPQELKNTIGHFAYILEGLKDFGNIRAHKITYTADGKEYSGNYIYGSISNTTSVGGIVKLKNQVDLNDGLFEVIMVRKPANVIEINEILEGIANSNFSSPLFDFFKAGEINLSMGKTIPWTLDGEKAEGASRIIIKNIHSAVKLYR